MRRITMWAMSTLTALVLLFSYHTSTAGSGGPVAAATSVQAPAAAGSGSTDSGSTDSAAKTYTGDAVDTRWGPVQVQITVQGGTITSAEAVVYPTQNHRDVEINSRAVPVLEQEAVQAQSADIHMVSGATVTSEGYRSSLQSAIDRANL